MKNSECPAKNSKFMHVVSEKGHPLFGKEIGVYEKKPTGNLIPCNGEAHDNPGYIDHCMICAPRWGQMEEYKPVDPRYCEEKGLAVACSYLSAAQMDDEVKNHGATYLSVSTVRRSNRSECGYMCCIVWPSLKEIKR